MSTFDYFSYGSNMSSVRLSSRTPSATVKGKASLDGYRLTFDKRSKDGSGKCHIEKTNNAEDKIWGVLYSIDVSEKKKLDDAEGLGCGYEESKIKVLSTTGVIDSVVYLATDRDSSLVPYDWYHEHVTIGAAEHELPKEYQNSLLRIPFNVDQNTERAKKERSIYQK